MSHVVDWLMMEKEAGMEKEAIMGLIRRLKKMNYDKMNPNTLQTGFSDNLDYLIRSSQRSGRLPNPNFVYKPYVGMPRDNFFDYSNWKMITTKAGKPYEKYMPPKEDLVPFQGPYVPPYLVHNLAEQKRLNILKEVSDSMRGTDMGSREIHNMLDDPMFIKLLKDQKATSSEAVDYIRSQDVYK